MPTRRHIVLLGEFANECIALGEEYHQLFALSASPILNVGFVLVFHQAVIGTVKPSQRWACLWTGLGVSLDRIGLDVLEKSLVSDVGMKSQQFEEKNRKALFHCRDTIVQTLRLKLIREIMKCNNP